MNTSPSSIDIALAPEPFGKRDLVRFVQVYDGALEPGFCERVIQSFGRLQQFHSRNGNGAMRQLDSSAWTELNVSRASDKSMEAYFRDQAARYLAKYNESLHLTLPVPLRQRMEDLRIKQYLVREGDRFQPHFDSLDYTCNRYLVFLWYLNDVSKGGETEFCDLDIRIEARAGRLLIFPPYWMFQHAGRPPHSNDKYIISSYMLF